jgi:choline dehydrogenase-like flavoprotein
MPTEQVDVVVVGSGAGGSPVALMLAQAGMRVVVLEKGRDVSRAEMEHDEIRMTRRNFFVPYVKDEPHTVRYGQHKEAEPSADGWTANIVGGGTAHYSGFFHRMHPCDMRAASLIGKSVLKDSLAVDWPITYDVLEPYYAQVEREVGVSGVWKRHPFEEPRSADFPLPPLAEHPLAAHIDAAGAKVGCHPFPTPRAVLTRPRDGRDACIPCVTCGNYGCPSGAKGSTGFALLPRAVATGRCEVRAECMVVEVTVDSSGKASGVRYRDRTNETRFLGARCVVLACTAIETARLMLLSTSSRFPSGIANGSGLVGRNLVLSSLGKAEATWYHNRGKDRSWLKDPASPFVQRSIQDYYLLPKPQGRVRKTGTLLFLLGRPGPIAMAERIAHGKGSSKTPLWGPALKDQLRREGRDAVWLECEQFGEFLPTAGTYVDLDPKVKDRFGLPAARITIDRHPHDLEATRYLLDRGLEVLRAMEPDDVRETVGHGATIFLQGGTCRFGTDPASSVLDPSCRAHEVPNLYVADGSFLPTSGGVPVTMTIMANAFRVGAGIAQRFKAGKL